MRLKSCIVWIKKVNFINKQILKKLLCSLKEHNVNILPRSNMMPLFKCFLIGPNAKDKF